MYTQCPDCSTAFRVTADILRKAAGKVRCGGCGNAFNALEFLSESMPEQAPRKEPEDDLPELTPEPLSAKKNVPASISAEQSAALLKTLDELAGSDIRIEDTGVEWRVLDDDELADAADNEVSLDVDVEDQPLIDEILEDSPTPVDQFLTDTPPQVDSPEIFEQAGEAPARTSVDELRFDDNTPLPDDFDFADDANSSLPDPKPKAEAEAEAEAEAIVASAGSASQVDFDLSDPHEWTDILDEFKGLAEDLARPEPDSDDGIGAPALSEDSEGEPDTLVADPNEASIDESLDEETLGDETLDDAPLDMDSQFALQAEAMGIDFSGTHETAGQPEDTRRPATDLEALLEESGEEVRDLEGLLEEGFVDEDSDATLIAEDETLDDDNADDQASDDESLVAAAIDEQAGDEEAVDDKEVDDEAWDDEAAQLDLIDDEFSEPVDDMPMTAAEAVEEHFIPPMTEEEQTINMQIDQDLLAIAVEDDDGFASTMVIPEDAPAEKAVHEAVPQSDELEEEDDDGEQALKNTGAGFETIIMEGEAFRFDLDDDKLEDQKAAAAASLASVAEAEKAARDEAQSARKRKYGIAAGIAVLTLLLAGQLVHQARNSLATIPAFNSVAGPMYRAIGQPLSPDWDITGWRFEVTDGKTDTENASLAIVSRLGNRSETPLPYPIIAVSLSDRFEEPLGSVTLGPTEYLDDNLDPRKLVEPGNSFEAKFRVSALPENATTYRLRACYRTSAGQLRCKEDDFK